MLFNFCMLFLSGLVLMSFNYLLKTLVLVELSMVCILLSLFLFEPLCFKMMFLLVLALAALEAGVGFTLLVKLLRIYKSPSNMFMLNL